MSSENLKNPKHRKWETLLNCPEILLKVSKFMSFSNFSDNLADYKTENKVM